MSDKMSICDGDLDYLHFFKENHLGVLTIDGKNRCVLDANPAACKLYNHQRDTLIGMPLAELNIAVKEDLREEIERASEENRRYLRMKHRSRDGKPVDVLVYGGSEKPNSEGIFHLIVSDVTFQIKKVENLRKNEERLAFAIESNGDGVWDLDIKSGELFYSKSWGEVLGMDTGGKSVSPKTEWIGRIHPEDRARVVLELEEHIAGKTPIYQSEYRLAYEKDKYIWLLDRGKVVEWDEEGNPTRVVGTDSEVTERKMLELELKRTVEELKSREQEILHLSYHDDLTGLPNRRLFNEKLQLLNRPEEMPLTIMIGDVNGLKLTNDVFGHTAGDELLKAVADIMRKNVRDRDIPARCGGDEFIILMPKTGEKEAEIVMDHIRKDCASFSATEGPNPSISLGFSTKYSTDVDSLFTFKLAEDMMYTSKLLENRSYRSGLINSMKSSLQEKNHETQLHAMRLKEDSINIARAMNIPEHLLDELELFSVLHDIGKIAIRDSILEKPGPLDEFEWVEMKRHSEIGYHIAKSAPELVHIAELILCHHEHWDGRGYPRGLKGEEIPLFSRIIAVVDSYDAMISDRPYRRALAQEKALEELRKGAGSQFDPEVVRVFLEHRAQAML